MTDARPALELDQLVDLEVQLELDAELDPNELRQRDRRIGLDLAEVGSDRRALILAWLERVREPGGSPGRRAAQALRAVTLVLAALGLILGSGTATGLLAASRPVNVWYFLGVLVLAQVALLGLWCLAALPPMAWLARLQSTLPALAPGRLAPLLGRVLPARTRQGLEVVVGRWAIFDRLYGTVRRWQILALSQAFAVGFNLGALAASLVLILFTGLEFAWSTTPDSGAALEWVFAALARPWAWVLPEAAPSAQLVEATRYWPGRGFENPRGLELASGWWPFLVVSLVFYGLAPRVLTAWFSRSMLRRSLNRVALDHTGYQRLVERLREPLVETRAPGAEVLPEEGGAGVVPMQPLDLAKRTATVLDWGAIGLAPEELTKRLVERFGVPVAEMLAAGGPDPAGDARALERIPRDRGDRAVLVVVKAWEAPTRDLRNFLGELRVRLGDGAPLVVVPVELDTDGRPALAEEADLLQWTRKLVTLGDPWLRVEVLVPGVSP